MTELAKHPDPTSTRPTRPTRPTLRAAELGLALPPGWRRRRSSAPDVVLAARAAALAPSGLRPELVLRSADVVLDAVRWRAEEVERLRRTATDFDLEDDDEFDLLGEPVTYLRYAERREGVDVLCERWAWLLPERHLGLSLTCAAAREEHPWWTDVFDEVADSIDLGPLRRRLPADQAPEETARPWPMVST